jgi:hypothetical protein
MKHLTAEELATIVKCDIKTLEQGGETSGIKNIKRCINEITLCWGEMKLMSERLEKYRKLLEPPKDNPQLKKGAQLWYE